MAYRYRDTENGRFVSKSTWKRSKAQDGTRYKRKRVRKREPVLPPPPPPPPPPSEVKTFFVTLRYTSSHGTRQFDFFVRARNAEDVDKYIIAFAQRSPRLRFSPDDPRATNVIEYLASFTWTERQVAEIPSTEFAEYENEKEGFVEYQ